jgi:hypothetical protein
VTRVPPRGDLEAWLMEIRTAKAYIKADSGRTWPCSKIVQFEPILSRPIGIGRRRETFSVLVLTAFAGSIW